MHGASELVGRAKLARIRAPPVAEALWRREK